jgi:hypothetical protein
MDRRLCRDAGHWPYQATRHYYHPIDEWIAGMGIVSARTALELA